MPATTDALMLWRETKRGVVEQVSVGHSGATFESSGAVVTHEDGICKLSARICLFLDAPVANHHAPTIEG